MKSDIKTKIVTSDNTISSGANTAPETKSISVNVISDDYSVTSDNKYNKLLNGTKFKATETDSIIGEMLGSIQEVDIDTLRYLQDPVQALIEDKFMLGDYDANQATPDDFSLPDVPKVADILTVQPEAQEDMAQVVKNYVEREKDILQLLNANSQALDPSNMYKYTPEEITALQEHRKDLEYLLALDRAQLKIARYKLKITDSETELEDLDSELDNSDDINENDID